MATEAEQMQGQAMQPEQQQQQQGGDTQAAEESAVHDFL